MHRHSIANKSHWHYNTLMTHPWNNIPLSLYIHVPWCERKCPYCDFNSHQSKSIVDEDAYITALLSDLDQDLNDFGNAVSDRSISSIFIGGGTPSLFSSQSYNACLINLKTSLISVRQLKLRLRPTQEAAKLKSLKGFGKPA